MKVLMQSRSNFNSLAGGDTVQLLKTKEQLEKLGVEVDLSLEWEPDLSGYDLVHLSNVTRIQETYLQMRNAKKYNKPVVLSTIFWPMDEFEKNGQIGIRGFLNARLDIDRIEKIKAAARYIKDKTARNIATKNLITVGYSAMQKYVVENADVFLPNSEMEMGKLCETFGLPKENYVVVPNGIDADIAKEKLAAPEVAEFEKFKDAIICVGRIETRKNQLALVKALDGSPYTIVLVGNVSGNHKDYFKQIQYYLDKNENFHYIPRVENDKIYQLYKVCKVSALPSWLDTPGLVSLEAAAMGCNLAMSTKGSTYEYFKDEAFYCEPDDIDSIRAAVTKAYETPKGKTLQDIIFQKYTWEEAARQTLVGYEMALERFKMKES